MGLLLARRMYGKNKQGRPFRYTWWEGGRTVPHHSVRAKEWAVAFTKLQSKCLDLETSLGSWKYFSWPQEEHEVSIIVDPSAWPRVHWLYVELLVVY